MKGLRYLLEALAKLRTEREVALVVIGRGRKAARRPAPSTSSACGDCVDVRHRRARGAHHRALLRGRAGRRALALRGLLAAGHRGHVVRRARSWPPPAAPCPRSSAPTTTPRCSCPPGDSEALAARIATALDDPELRARVGAAGRQRVIDRWTWRHTAVGTVEHYRALLAETADIQAPPPGRRRRRAPVPRRRRHRTPAGAEPMLTVDYDRLGLRAGDLLLDLGCGFGRHAFEGFRRGARVVACDMAIDRAASRSRSAVRGHGRPPARSPPDGIGDCVNGDATRLPFADDTFDRIIASEVMEHIPDDLARARRAHPGAQARRHASPSPSRPGCPRRSAGRCPTSTTRPTAVGGHVRIYTEDELRAKMRGAGLEPTAPPTTPTPCTRPTGG